MARTYTTPIRSAQAAASRRRILDAALRLFARDGYPATTLTAIADEAGVAVETVYKHFQSKPRLLQRLLSNEVTDADTDLDPVSGLTSEQVAALTAAPDPERRLEAICAFVRRMYERTATLQRIFGEAAGTDPDLRAIWHENRARRVHDTNALLASFAREGSLRLPPDDAVDIAWTLTGPELFTMLTDERGWDGDRYERWLLDTLRSQLLHPPR
jgi:AcrR family transcriptional regulator